MCLFIVKSNANGNVVYHMKQIGAYADDIVLNARNTEALREMLSVLIDEGRKIGLDEKNNKAYENVSSCGEKMVTKQHN